LDYIARDGHVDIRVHRLAKRLGVTEGSFYWHFENRDEFLIGLVDYWREIYTEAVPSVVDAVRDTASNRLLTLMTQIVREDLAKYDFVMQALALQEPIVAKTVAKVYKRRLDYVGALFEELGFRGRQLEMRTRAFVTYMSMDRGLYTRESKKERLELVKEAHAFFSRL
jgi:AcrR family transcriptional regulator